MSSSIGGHSAGGDVVKPAISPVEAEETKGFRAVAKSRKNIGFPFVIALFGGVITFLLTQRFLMVGYVLLACFAGYGYNIISDDRFLRPRPAGNNQADSPPR